MPVYKAVESVTRNGDGTLTAVTRPCGGCGSPGQIAAVPELGFLALKYGATPQDAIPDVSAQTSVQLMTGTCTRCQKPLPQAGSGTA